MQFDDEKDINNGTGADDNFSDAISWEDLLNADDDTDFSGLIKVDEDAGSPAQKKEPSILDYDMSSYKDESDAALDLDNPASAAETDAKSAEIQSFSDTKPAAPAQSQNTSYSQQNASFEKSVQNYGDIVDDELLNLLNMDPEEKEKEYGTRHEEAADTYANEIEAKLEEAQKPEPRVIPSAAFIDAGNSNIEPEAKPKADEPAEDFVPYVEKKKKNSGAILFAAVFIIVIGAAGYAAYMFYPDLFSMIGASSTDLAASSDIAGDASKYENNAKTHIEEAEAIKKETEDLMAGGDKTKEADKKLEEKKKAEEKVVVSVSNTGRKNPFMPSAVFEGANFSTFMGSLSLPPDPLVPAASAPSARNLMSIVISGIMYDPEKPSAIVKLGGTDYFVQKGDRIENYAVTNIAKDFVVMQNGANIYKINLGQTISIEDVNRSLEEDSMSNQASGTRLYNLPDGLENY